MDQLELRPVPDFIDLLSSSAKAIYDRPLYSTIQEYLWCTTCNREVLPSEYPETGPVETLLRPVTYLNHPDHEVERHARYVLQMGFRCRSSLLMTVAHPKRVEAQEQRGIKLLADAFNFLVLNRDIPELSGTLMRLHRVALRPEPDASQESLLVLAVAVDKKHGIDAATLNRKLLDNGMWPFFFTEGERAYCLT